MKVVLLLLMPITLGAPMVAEIVGAAPKLKSIFSTLTGSKLAVAAKSSALDDSFNGITSKPFNGIGNTPKQPLIDDVFAKSVAKAPKLPILEGRFANGIAKTPQQAVIDAKNAVIEADLVVMKSNKALDDAMTASDGDLLKLNLKELDSLSTSIDKAMANLQIAEDAAATARVARAAARNARNAAVVKDLLNPSV